MNWRDYENKARETLTTLADPIHLDPVQLVAEALAEAEQQGEENATPFQCEECPDLENSRDQLYEDLDEALGWLEGLAKHAAVTDRPDLVPREKTLKYWRRHF